MNNLHEQMLDAHKIRSWKKDDLLYPLLGARRIIAGNLEWPYLRLLQATCFMAKGGAQ
jgi:hypothetical protein